MNHSQYCIECGRELKEYISETLHVCNICETKKSEYLTIGKRYIYLQGK